MERPWVKSCDPRVTGKLGYPNRPRFLFLERAAAAQPDAIATTLNDAENRK